MIFKWVTFSTTTMPLSEAKYQIVSNSLEKKGTQESYKRIVKLIHHLFVHFRVVHITSMDF